MIQKNDDETRRNAAKIIAGGGIIAFRTDTFYGLGADPFNASAVGKIRKLKGREEAKPILLLISDLSEVTRFISDPSETFKSVADRFWPGPITLIGVAQPELPIELTAGTKTIGLRLPDDEDVRTLVRACGGALTATSANTSSNDPATTADEVVRYFPVGVDLILDGGTVTATEPSTVLDLSTASPRLIREGAIKREMLGGLSADFADYTD
ncbi:MAG: L-threonylcarbamoyladenylate synthase [Acidobacteriota bacterium]